MLRSADGTIQTIYKQREVQDRVEFDSICRSADRIVQGVDDVLAMLLALSGSSEDIEVILISVTFGNVEVKRLVAKCPSTDVC